MFGKDKIDLFSLHLHAIYAPSNTHNEFDDIIKAINHIMSINRIAMLPHPLYSLFHLTREMSNLVI